MEPRKPRGKPWVKGQSGNPKGKPKHPDELKIARVVNRFEFEKIANRFLYMTKEEIASVASDPATVGIELIVASLITNAVKHGDQHRFGFLLERLVGKIPDVVQVSGLDGSEIKIKVRSKLQEMLSDPESRAAIEVLEKKIGEPKD